MIRFIFLIFCVFCGGVILAQPDTLVLPEFEKTEWRYKQLKDFLPTLDSDSASLSFFAQGPITDLLQNTMPLVVRNLGPSHSVSVSNRGLSAAHTAIYWQGINMNSPTTGIADFSLIPGAFVQSLGVNLGGSSAIMGSGSLGGGIHLSQPERPNEPVRIDWTNTVTSTRNLESSLRTVFSDDQWTSKTNVLWNASQNHFPYINEARAEKPLEYRQSSQFNQRGLTQHVSKKLGNHQIGLDLWGLETDRLLPPSLTASNTEEQQYDRNLKAVLQGHFNFSKVRSRVQFGVLDDVLRYQNANGINSHITSSQWVLNADFKGHVNQNWKIVGGTNNTLQNALASGNYADEERILNNAIYAGANYFSDNDFWEASVLLRYEVFSNYRNVPSPSLALKIRPWSWSEWTLSASRNYRIPGLNDRFWSPGGNPGLDPEDAYQFNLGQKFELLNSAHQNISVTFSEFYNYIQNWIQWTPQEGYWGAVNYKSVYTLGINASADYSYRHKDWGIDVNVHYVWTEARNHRSAYDEALAGSMLPHMPEHKSTAVVAIAWKTLQLYLNGTYTSLRYLSAENVKFMDPFLLTNGGLKWQMNLAPVHLEVSGRVHNLLNANYEVMPWMPMPLRNYSISLKMSFVKTKKQQQ